MFFFKFYLECFFIRSLPYGNQFSPTQNLSKILGFSQVTVFSQVPSTCAGLQDVIQFTHLLMNYYPQLVSNPRSFHILSPIQLCFRHMPLYRCSRYSRHLVSNFVIIKYLIIFDDKVNFFIRCSKITSYYVSIYRASAQTINNQCQDKYVKIHDQ